FSRGQRDPSVNRKWGLALASLVTIAILATLGWFWWSSLLPDEYSVMDMGYLDYGGGDSSHAMHEGAISIDTLRVNPDRQADVEYELTARQETFTLASGREVD